MSEIQMEEIIDRVLDVIRANAVVNMDKVNEYSKIKDELGIDSVRLINLIVDLEEEFGFKEAGNSLELDNFITVSSIAGYVIKKL